MGSSGKDGRRLARKEKQQASERRRILSQPKRFDPAHDKYRNAFAAEVAAAMKCHPSIVLIERNVSAADWSLSDTSLIERYRLGHLQHVTFEIDDGGHTSGGAGSGAVTLFFIDADGNKSTAILMRQKTSPPTDSSAAIMLAILFHELGHVDDYEKGLSLRPGEPLDVVRSEFNAHMHCLRRLHLMNYQTALAFWIFSLQADLGKCGVANVEEAARLALADDFTVSIRKPLDPIVQDLINRHVATKAAREK